MPGTFQDLADYDSTALTEDEMLFVRTPLLSEESTVAVPSENDINLALVSLSTAGIKQIRMHIDGYNASQTQIDGGPDAVTIDPVIKRWGIRNRVRLLLGFSAEPRPATSDSLQLLSIPLVSTICGSEW